MTAYNSLPAPATAEEYLAQSNPDVLRAMVKMFAEQLMSAEADALCGAEYGQVTTRRLGITDADALAAVTAELGGMGGKD